MSEDEIKGLIKGLMADLLVSHGRATARTSLHGWLEPNPSGLADDVVPTMLTWTKEQLN